MLERLGEELVRLRYETGAPPVGFIMKLLHQREREGEQGGTEQHNPHSKFSVFGF
jgi:hypothetical protein